MQNELDRLQAVHRFLNLKIDRNKEFQDVIELISEICETPIALITLIDGTTQVFLSKIGTDLNRTSKENSFCQYLINGDDLMVVPDALKDSRFADNPFVTNAPNIRFYAGASLNTYDGYTIGSICVLDTKPRDLTNVQKRLLKELAKRTIQFIELDLSVAILKEQVIQAKDNEVKLRSFFDSEGAYHLFIGKEHEVIAFNKKMADFLNRVYHVKLYAGIKADHILKGNELERFQQEYQTALNGIPVQYERQGSYRGVVIWWHVTLDPAYNAVGEIIGISYNANDVTERKLHEQQITAQNESLKSIAHIQSHEFRKPVASILGFMGLFKDKGYRSTKQELMMMEKAANELDAKIRTIVKITGEG